MNLIDHRILIWDHNAFTNSIINPVLIIDFFEYLIEALRINNEKISIDEKVFTEAFSDYSIPFGEIHEHYPELADLHSLLLSRFTALNNYMELTTYNFDNQLNTNPIIISHSYSHLVIEGVKQSLNYILCENEIHVFLSTENLINTNTMRVYNGNTEKVINVYNCRDGICEILDGLGRIFEMNPKHSPDRPHPGNRGNKVAILSTSKECAQELLIFAKGDSSKSNKLYNYDQDNDSYIIFMPHRIEKKTYHAYNVEDIPKTLKDKLNL